MKQNIVITGAGRRNNLGHMIAQCLSHYGHTIMCASLDFDPGLDVANPMSYFYCDVTDKKQVMTLANSALTKFNGNTDILINCAGINLINMLEDVSEDEWDKVLDVNTKSIYLTAKAFLPQLIASKGTILNIVSNASHMPMTSSLAYNASKGAAHIMTLQLARELTRRHGITVFGISPNKLKGTGMSEDIANQVCQTRGWTPEQAESYQLASLLAGEETDPFQLAELVAFLLSSKNRHKFLTGCVLPYGA